MRTSLADHPSTTDIEGTQPTDAARPLDKPGRPAPAQITVTVSLPNTDDIPAWASALQDWLQQVTGPQPLTDRRDPPGAGPAQAAPAPEPELVMNAAARTAHVGGNLVRLTRQEFDLLRFLTTHSGQVFTRAQLMQQAWNGHSKSSERTIDVHVRRLRVRLAGKGPTITTVYGVGYRLDDSDRATVISESPAPPRGTQSARRRQQGHGLGS